MGRTVETFTMVIQEQRMLWKKFREALRKEDQQVLDELFRAPKIHLAACAYDVKPIPFENVVISMLIEERKKSIMLQEIVDKLNERVKKLEIENAKECSGMAV
jgi:predicted nucleotide-binding protein (sugar kinase/HSP70/actin superfamily)